MINRLLSTRFGLFAGAALLLLALASCGNEQSQTDATVTDSAPAADNGDQGASDSALAADDGDQGASDSALAADDGDQGASDSALAAEDGDQGASDSAQAADDGDHSLDGVDVGLFMDGALIDEATMTSCELSNGSQVDCYRLTIAGYPADGDAGPFCPTSIADTADQAGIWLDGEAVYDLDGQFIVDLPEIYGDDTWQLYDEDGNVRVTETLEAFEAAARPDVDPEFQNYCVEGRLEWLDGGVPVQSTVEIPAVPVRAAGATPTSGSVGITLNGVTIDGQAPVDAILGAYTIAAFDDCGAHFNPTAGYHMHGATGCSEVGEAEAGDTPMFGYALDGFAIHSPFESGSEPNDLDECNGHTTEASGYHYHANPAEENSVLSCFMGETVGAVDAGGGRGRGDRPDGPPPGADE